MTLMEAQRMQARLGPLAGRFDVDAVDECDSTNSELMRRAERGAPSGSVLVADRQLAGRGRRGRQWASAPESGLTFSLLWRFAGAPARMAGLSLAVGLALAQGAQALGARGVGLKWPNDVLLQSADGEYAKLGGVLVELSSDRRGTQAVIGIGLNLLPPAVELPQPTAGLSQAMRGPVDRHAVLAAMLGELAGVLDRFAVDGFAGLKSAWQRHHVWQDASVRLLDEGGEVLAGRCLGVADDGSLLLETAGGVQNIYSGDVSLRRA